MKSLFGLRNQLVYQISFLWIDPVFPLAFEPTHDWISLAVKKRRQQYGQLAYINNQYTEYIWKISSWWTCVKETTEIVHSINTCMFRGIPDVSLFIYIAQCSCKKSHASLIICTFAPDWRCFIITSLMNTTSDSFIVKSSSFLYKIKYHILKYLQSLKPADDHVTYLPSHTGILSATLHKNIYQYNTIPPHFSSNVSWPHNERRACHHHSAVTKFKSILGNRYKIPVVSKIHSHLSLYCKQIQFHLWYWQQRWIRCTLFVNTILHGTICHNVIYLFTFDLFNDAVRISNYISPAVGRLASNTLKKMRKQAV